MRLIWLLTIWILGGLFFGYLFYSQEPHASEAGLGYAAVFLLGFASIATGGKPAEGSFFVLAQLMSGLAAVSLMLYGPGWPIGIFWFGWLAWGGAFAGGGITLPLAFGKGLLSIALAPIGLLGQIVVGIFRRSQPTKVLQLTLAAFALLTFGLLYASTSQVLSDLLTDLWEWIAASLDLHYWLLVGLGWLVLAPLLHPLGLPFFAKAEQTMFGLPLLGMLGPTTTQEATIVKRALVGIIALALLPATIDLLALAGLWHAPADAPASQVHQAVSMLMISCTLIAALAALIFRQPETVLQYPGLVKLFYGFLACNLLLVVVTCLKNGIYIGHYGLTHKRLGVFMWLALVLVGLGLTAYKVRRGLTFYELVRASTWAAGLCIASYCLLPADYWVRQSQLARAEPDYAYLVYNLSDAELAQLATTPAGRQQYQRLQNDTTDVGRNQLDTWNRGITRSTAPQAWQGQSLAYYLARSSWAAATKR